MYSKVIRQIEHYVDGAISREDFEAWLYDLAFDVEERYSRRVISLVHVLEGTLAEASSGNWREAVLKIELNKIMSARASCVIVFGEPTVQGWAHPPIQVRLAHAM